MDDWIQKLVNTYSNAIYNFCFYLTGNREAAEDLYQDTFLTAMEKEEVILPLLKEQDGMDEEEKLKRVKNYLLGIAIRLFKYKKRKLQWRSRIVPMVESGEGLENAFDETFSPEESYLYAEKCETVRRLIYGLPDKLRLVVVLYYLEEKSAEEIAGVLNISASTVRSRLHRARKQLQKKLEESGYEI